MRGRRLARECLKILATILAWAVVAQPALAQSAGPAATADAFSFRDVGFDPHLGAQTPLELVFKDEAGHSVRLGDYIHDRPVLLTLNDFTCQDLCPLELRNLVDTMNQVPFKLGTEYAALAVSINPANTPQDAADLRSEIMHRYGRPDAPNAAEGWHFLTGDQTAITQLAQTAGLRYAYDALSKSYAHPVGAILLTPDGHMARYLYGMDFPPNDLRLAINEASQGVVSRPIDPILLLCYHYDVATGRYTNVALGAVRAGGILTLLGLGTFLGVMWRREYLGRKKRDADTTSPA